MASPRLVTYVYVDGVAYGPDDVVPPEVAARITAPENWEGGALPQGAAADPAPASEPSPYEAMTVAQLTTEAMTRNEGRAKADRLPTKGRAAIIAALLADDQTN